MSREHRMPLTQLLDLFDRLNDPGNKGKALEEFCVTFFSAIPGIQVATRNVLDNAHSQELDLVLDNVAPIDGLDFLKDFIFVEAKNWKIPVGSAEVAWLDWKIRMSGSDTDGVLVATNGVTGRPEDKTSAWTILGMANMEGRRIFVITPEEMISCETVDDVHKLLKQKWRKLATGNAPIP
ncbi:hypothetical protein QEN42_02175 [Gordonia alkanivorans]|uniref:hypothetical protein n=1 Tax=Gordonia alkanivorans TaxID=84096 RepID=UPI0024483EF6|nr:hypothetical protein [Gordonia alkanivorans]MDH3048681.1 hypothetical protein [Gordonia alkanivorans]